MDTKSYPPLGSVLVTGGCGFLGSHIVSLLLDRSTSGTQVSVLDLTTTRNRYDGADYYDADITDQEAIQRVLEKTRPAVIIHTASPTAFALRLVQFRVNVTGTEMLLEQAQKAGVRAFVHTSSSSVVSDTRSDLINADERWSRVTGQGEYYSDTKAQAEEIVIAANRTPDYPNFCTLALRPAAIFGERDAQIIDSVIWVLRSGKSHWQLGSNDNLFDFTYAGNAAHAHILAAAALLKVSKENAPLSEEYEEKMVPLERKSLLPKSVDGEVFFITNQAPITFWDFNRAIWWAYVTELSKTSSSTSKSDVPMPSSNPHVISRTLGLIIAFLLEWVSYLLHLGTPTLTMAKTRYACMTRYYRTTKSERVLGYYPLWTLQEGIKRAAQWYVERELAEEGKS